MDIDKTFHSARRTGPDSADTATVRRNGATRAGRPLGGILTRFIRARRGAVALEFAIGLPIFLAMIYGIFEFGRVFWTKNTMEFAVEEAARFTVVNPNAATGLIVSVVEDKAAGLDVSLINVAIAFEQAAGDRTFVNITGTYSYAPMIPLVIPYAGGDGFDFKALEMNLVTTTRMALVIP